MSKHSIAVLQDDIDNGIVASHTECPIARAARRDLQLEDYSVTVDYMRIFLGMNFAPLPHEATTFAQRFDAGRPVEAFKFEIELED